ncbi:hypothetical protein DYE49_11165 [Treponema rectale]|uniref:DNA-directed RNA polymerase subunit L n=1 Tax=Treponema rectale TaxID=744512 RepID=A0A840SE22_9SPIR|nr:hypothetical protein [Treponema rectale]MBB5219124.1 DNA-directed RNA polymerase subunit L [Treponema rectale]QOS40974.1 hypothetical protein DYE49_11165 [Treponema rectale]
MRKLLITLATVVSLVFTGCNDIDEENASASLLLDREAVVMTNALGGYTTAKVNASYTGPASDLEWFSANKSIVTVSSENGTSAVILCQGKEGSANIGVRTSDGSLEAVCTVSVSLSAAPATGVSDLQLVEDSETERGFTLKWTDPTRANGVVIDVYKSEEDRTAGLAKIAAREVPEVYSTYTVEFGKEEHTVTDLLTDQVGKNYYVAVCGYLNNYRSLTAETVDVQLKPDVTPPSNVTGVTSSVTDHAVTLTWTDPEDDDYSYVDVSINSDAVDYSGTVIDSSEITKKINKALQTVTFDNLKADQEYTFTFKTADVNGNQQDEGISESVSTAADTTAPAAVSGAAANAGRRAVSLTWTDPDTVDLKELHVYMDDSENYTVVAKSAESNRSNVLQVSDLEELTSYSFVIKACDYNGNESSAATVSATTANPVATNVKAVCSDINFADASLTATVSWTVPSAVEYSNGELVTYNYRVNVTSGGTDVTEVTTAAGAKSVEISGLTYGDDYIFKVTTIPSDEGEFTGTDSSVEKTLIGMIAVKNNWGGRVLVPFKTSAKSYVNCVIVQDDSSKTYNPSVMTYPYWIVRAPLNGTSGYFSLEAATADGEASGIYLYFSATTPSGSTNYDVDGTGWGSGSSPHCFYGDVGQIGTDIAKACFKFDEETNIGAALDGCSAWMAVKTADGKYFWSGNSNPGLMNSIDKTKGDYSWCYKVITE